MEIETIRKVQFFRTVYDVLTEYAGAPSRLNIRENFAAYHSHVNEAMLPTEWRFEGFLGFGGKFNISSCRGMYVTCYPEDETPYRIEVLQKVNNILSAMGGSCKWMTS